MDQLLAILAVWPFVLAIELSIAAAFIWLAKDKKINGSGGVDAE